MSGSRPLFHKQETYRCCYDNFIVTDMNNTELLTVFRETLRQGRADRVPRYELVTDRRGFFSIYIKEYSTIAVLTSQASPAAL